MGILVLVMAVFWGADHPSRNSYHLTHCHPDLAVLAVVVRPAFQHSGTGRGSTGPQPFHRAQQPAVLSHHLVCLQRILLLTAVSGNISCFVHFISCLPSCAEQLSSLSKRGNPFREHAKTLRKVSMHHKIWSWWRTCGSTVSVDRRTQNHDKHPISDFH